METGVLAGALNADAGVRDQDVLQPEVLDGPGCSDHQPLLAYLDARSGV